MIPDVMAVSTAGLSHASSAAAARSDVRPWLSAQAHLPPTKREAPGGQDHTSADLSAASQASPMVEYSPIAGLRPFASVGGAVGRAVRRRTLGSPFLRPSRCQRRLVRSEASVTTLGRSLKRRLAQFGIKDSELVAGVCG